MRPSAACFHALLPCRGARHAWHHSRSCLHGVTVPVKRDHPSRSKLLRPDAHTLRHWSVVARISAHQRTVVLRRAVLARVKFVLVGRWNLVGLHLAFSSSTRGPGCTQRCASAIKRSHHSLLASSECRASGLPADGWCESVVTCRWGRRCVTRMGRNNRGSLTSIRVDGEDPAPSTGAWVV